MLRPGSKHEIGSVCKVGTQDPENLDEEVKPLVTVWWFSFPGPYTRFNSILTLHFLYDEESSKAP